MPFRKAIIQRDRTCLLYFRVDHYLATVKKARSHGNILLYGLGMLLQDSLGMSSKNETNYGSLQPKVVFPQTAVMCS